MMTMEEMAARIEALEQTIMAVDTRLDKVDGVVGLVDTELFDLKKKVEGMTGEVAQAAVAELMKHPALMVVAGTVEGVSQAACAVGKAAHWTFMAPIRLVRMDAKSRKARQERKEARRKAEAEAQFAASPFGPAVQGTQPA